MNMSNTNLKRIGPRRFTPCGGSPSRSYSKALEAISRKHAPKPIAAIGELVETNWCGRGIQDRIGNPLVGKLRKVMISEIGIHLVSTCGPNPPERVVPQIYYYAFRVGKDGQPKKGLGMICLTNFRKADGTEWIERNQDFNHCGLSWTVARVMENVKAHGTAGGGNQPQTH